MSPAFLLHSEGRPRPALQQGLEGFSCVYGMRAACSTALGTYPVTSAPNCSVVHFLPF
jgi:hypothetical protein